MSEGVSKGVSKGVSEAGPTTPTPAVGEPPFEVPSHRPLAGVLVADLSRYLPGPLVTRLLGDLGARVIKIEEPTVGDPSRQAPPLVDGRSSLSALLLAGHRSVALDLRRENARRVLDELLEEADVMVESYRPGVLGRWGMAPLTLRERHPRLVICSVSGWGQRGPHAHRAGHDLGYQAVAGSLAGGQGMPAVQVADVVGAWSAALAVTAALFRRRKGGEGCWIDQALVDAAGHANATAWAVEAEGGKAVGEPLPLTGALPCYDLYETSDGGQVAMAALEPKFWQRFCQAVERKDLVRRQFSNDPAVRREVAELMASRSRGEWAALFAEHDVPAEPVLSAAEALVHPQVEARGMFSKGPDKLRRMAYPALIDGERPRSEDQALPGLGAHTAELVEALELDEMLESRSRRRGIGRRFSLRAWAAVKMTAWLTRRQ